jgi:MFS transporter, DHA1 family, inner membrane transport protein
MKTATLFPIILGIVLLLSFFTGKSTLPMLLTIIFFGILLAIRNNVGQYWVTSSAPEAPDLANGLYLSCGNLDNDRNYGMGAQYVVLGEIGFLILTLVSILLRYFIDNPTTKQLAS